MWPSRALIDLLNIEHPLLQAPMAGASTPALAAAVCNAGGMGSLGCAFHTPEQLQADVEAVRRATNHPFNLNFFVHEPPRRNRKKAQRARELMAPYYGQLGLETIPEVCATHEPFDEEMLQAVLQAAPAVVSFHFGLPEDDYVRALKAAGVTLLCSATSVREARDLERRGANAIIAQGWEAGGHRGTYLSSFDGAGIGTLALVPQIVDAVEVPVIAAGGIADGRGIAAAFALGASGVQIGTAFLTCQEAGAPAVHKQALLEAADDETRITKTFSGRPARGLVNRYIEEMTLHEHALPDFPLMNTLTAPLRKASAAQGSRDFVALWSGQAVTLNRELPATALFTALLEETSAVIARFRGDPGPDSAAGNPGGDED